MVWLEPLGLNEAGEFLDRRVTGVPASFLALCYVLSGGLPRDLLRVARAVFTTPGAQPAANDGQAAAGAGDVTLAAAACHVIEAELQALKHRTLASAVSFDISAAPELLTLLTDDRWPASRLDSADGEPAAVVEAILNELCLLWAGSGRRRFAGPRGGEVAPFTAEVCDSLLAGLYFLLTVRQLFTQSPEVVQGLAWLGGDACRTRGERRQWLDDANPVLRDLARARIALGTSPYLAAELISAARGQLSGHPGFGVLAEPGFLSHAPADC
jgi:hypothetical protein